MARIRTIKPAFFTSQDVVSCSPLARLLFIGLWCEADKAGRLHDKPTQIKMRLLPNDPVDVDALLWELHDATLIRRVELPDGAGAIYIPKFSEHQKPHPKEPESAIDASGREKTRQAVEKHGEVVMLPGDFPATTARKGREGKEYGDQEGKGRERGSALMMSPSDFERLHRFNAYVGARVRVPHKLHGDLVALLGGDDPDGTLRTWYAEVDEELERTREPITPDIWKWLTARFKAWSVDRVNANIWAEYDRKHGIATGA